MNHLRIHSDIAVIHGYNLSFRAHANHAVKILIGEDAISVSLDHAQVKMQGAIIKANTLHKVKGGKGLLISLFINSHSKVGRAINNLVKNRVLKLGGNTAGKLLKYFNEALDSHLTEPDIEAFLLETLLDNNILESAAVLDDRIINVLDCIRSSSNYNVKFADLVAISGLSESRLIHLFKKEVGVTIRKYILWCRVQKALKAIASGSNIKQSASLAGFTDAAHFSRTVASMFGLSPSSLLR